MNADTGQAVGDETRQQKTQNTKGERDEGRAGRETMRTSLSATQLDTGVDLETKD